MLRIKNLKKHFGGVKAVGDVSFEIKFDHYHPLN